MIHRDQPDREEATLRWLVERHAAIAARDETATAVELPTQIDRGNQPEFKQVERCLRVLEDLRRESVEFSPSSKDATAAASDIEVPRRIGRFEIECELGRGGCAVVFLAYDPKLGRKLALKVPLPGVLLDKDLRARFLREAQTSASLDHPNLVTVFEAGELGPICYIASALVDGETLAAYLRNRSGSVPPKTAARWVRELAQAVQHAHSRGVLHRDIKPSNVLLDRRGATDAADDCPSADAPLVPRLSDFGLAKLLDAGGDFTLTGSVLGTPAYMAPEQAEGRTRDTDVRTDVYGLGALLYELLTGRPPFQSDSHADALRQTLFAEVIRPSRIRRVVHQDLESICLKCLAKDPQQRYPTAQQLSDDLDRFMAGKPTDARPTGVVERCWMWAKRRPVASAAAATLILCVVAVLGIVVTFNARLRIALDETTFERERATKEAKTSRELLYSSDVRLAYDSWWANNLPQALLLLARHRPERGKTDFREFSWHWLWRQCHPEVRTLAGHANEVFCVAFSPDGHTLATASKDGTARLWDVESGHTRVILEGHTDEVTRVAFSPLGDLLATSSEDGTIRLWNPTTGSHLDTLEGHDDHVLAIAFSPDGTRLVSGSHDKTVKVWNVVNRRSEATLDDALDFVRGVVFSPDGGKLFACDESGWLGCWSTESWSLLAAERAERALFAMAASADLSWVATAGQHELVRVWDYSANEIRRRKALSRGHTEWIQSVAFSPHDNTLASAGKDGVIQLWDLARREPEKTLLGHEGRIWCIAYSPDGQLLASAGADGSVKLWERAQSRTARNSYPLVPAPLRCVAFSPDGSVLATGSEDGVIRFWNPVTSQLLSSTKLHGGGEDLGVHALAFSPDGSKLVSQGQDGLTRIWFATTGEEHMQLQCDPGSHSHVAWAPSGKTICVTEDDRTVAVVDVTSGQVQSRTEHTHDVEKLAFSPNGRWLAIESQFVEVWDWRTGSQVTKLEGGDWLAFSPDGRMLASASGHVVSLWNTATWERRATLTGSGGDVRALSFSSDSHTLAVAYRDPSRIVLWDSRTGQELIELDAGETNIEDLEFSPSGIRLVAAVERKESGIGELIQWSIPVTAEFDLGNQPAAGAATDLSHVMANAPLRDEARHVLVIEPAADAGSWPHDSFRVSQIDSDSQSTYLRSSSVVRRTVRFSPARIIESSDQMGGACSLALGDVDNDGDIDVAAAWRSGLRLYRNDGSGQFGPATSIPSKNTSSFVGVDLADFDGDGWLDLVSAARRGGNRVAWHVKVGSGESIETRKHSNSRALQDVVAADLDGDRDPDLLWTSAGEREGVEIARNDDKKHFTDAGNVTNRAGSARALAVADIDADGDLDVIAASERRGTLAWYENVGNLQFRFEHLITSDAGNTHRVAAADLDGDGDFDVLPVSASQNRVVWFENLSEGNFGPPRILSDRFPKPNSVCIADLDGDGDLDSAIGSYHGNRLKVYLNDGIGNFTASDRPISIEGRSHDDLATADLNGDGRLDLVFALWNGEEVGWHANEGVEYVVEVPDELRFVPWPRNAVMVAHDGLLAGTAADAAPRVLEVKLETPKGVAMSTDDFRQLVERVDVYRDTNGNANAEPDREPQIATLEQPTLEEGILRITIPETLDSTTKSGVPLSSRSHSFDMSHLVAEVNRWARNHGHLGGFPMFESDDATGRTHLGVALVEDKCAKMTDVRLDELSASDLPPVSDAPGTDDYFARLSSSVDAWAQARGYTGGILVDAENDPITDQRRYRVLVFFDRDVERQSFHIAKLNYPIGYEALCREVQNKAVELGYIAAYPVSVSDSDEVECLLLPSNAAHLTHVPVLELR